MVKEFFKEYFEIIILILVVMIVSSSFLYVGYMDRKICGEGTYYENVGTEDGVIYYNCCKYETILNEQGYYGEIKTCKGFKKEVD